MTIKNESNTFEIFLNALVQDFGGLEIFDEENESRLNKAVKSLADSFSQKLYSVMEFPQEAQQKMIDNSLDELSSLGLTPQVCENVISSFISVLKLKGSATKKPEIEKIMGEMELDGEIYKTCQIGKQIWMAENLRASLFQTRNRILCPTPINFHRRNRYGTIGRVVPGYKYGRVYTCWEAGYYGKKDGWHLPSVEEWLELVQYIESLSFDAGTALKSVGDWDGNADSGLDLFGFGAHPIKYWDDNLPQKLALKTIDDIKIRNVFNFPQMKALKFNKELQEIENRIKSEEKKKIDNENSFINQHNTFVEMSTPVFPCIQFWTSTKYVDNPSVGDEMAYVATLGDFNKVDLDGGKVSYSGDIPFGFACVRLVKNIK